MPPGRMRMRLVCVPELSSRCSSRTSTNGQIWHPPSFARAQRASAFGRLLVGLLQNAAAHALALRDTELCGLHAAGERFLHAMRHVAVVGNPVFFNPGRATHMASSASRS